MDNKNNILDISYYKDREKAKAFNALIVKFLEEEMAPKIIEHINKIAKHSDYLIAGDYRIDSGFLNDDLHDMKLNLDIYING
jgi:hypothetical protein